jgi:hypothetical protein
LRISMQPVAGSDISGALIQNNVIVRAMQFENDGGAIYLQDTQGTSTNIQILHNYVLDYLGFSNNKGACIYADQKTSNVTVKNNVCRIRLRGAPATTAIVTNCANNMLWQNNIFDLGSSGIVQGGEFIKGGGVLGCTNMTSVSYIGNIILFNFAGNQHTDDTFGVLGYTYMCIGTPLVANPSIGNNMYFNYAGGQARTDGNCASDSSPVTGMDPLMADQYRLCTDAGVPVAGCTGASPALSAPLSFTQLAGGWGPPGFVLPP